LLDEASISKIAKISNLSIGCISQVKHGKHPPSQKLLNALQAQVKPDEDYSNSNLV
jgi:hypothetical protein